MIMFDVETLGKKTDSVILSMAAIQFEAGENKSFEDYCASAFFVKFDVADQVSRLNRKINKSTIEWWQKQCAVARIKSFKPDSSIDVKVEVGYESMRQWASKYNPKDWVWARGNLDQLILDAIEEQLDVKPIWHFSRWRDVRTAVDIIYELDKGYCEVNYPGFDPQINVTKHCPVNDCAYDIMQLLYGYNPRLEGTKNE